MRTLRLALVLAALRAGADAATLAVRTELAGLPPPPRRARIGPVISAATLRLAASFAFGQ
ncbi:MAG: hypothetical protein HY553_16710 [Elusimicrobia bacterium]|nr:hypothetical protein [Elusimicrobiota bacterium]